VSFHRSISLERSGRMKSGVVGDDIEKVAFFEKNDSLWEDLQNFVPKGFTTSHIHVTCANFVKFGRPEIGKVVRYLPDKKNKISARSLALAFARIAPKICQGQRQTMSAPNFIQVGSLPVEL